jgi:hypothetical protein
MQDDAVHRSGARHRAGGEFANGIPYLTEAAVRWPMNEAWQCQGASDVQQYGSTGRTILEGFRST